MERLIDAAVSCVTCGTKGMGNCDCQTRCTCGWWAEKGKPCRNPTTVLCSSKLLFYGSVRAAKAAAGSESSKQRG